jgi:dihydroorotase
VSASRPSIVIKGARIIDPAGERSGDVVVDGDGIIAAVGPDLSAEQVLDASGCVLTTGFVDLHSHLRQPGAEEAETVESGSRCAVLGGYTAVVAMPNTTPAIDNAGMVREVQALAREAWCDVAVAGAITVGRAGEQLAPMAEMHELGVRLFTDDGTGVQDNRLMRRALEYAGGLGVTLAQHCEDAALAAGGHMNEGEWSSRLGIAGQPAEAEELMVMRDIALARLTGTRVHFQHLSTSGSVAMVRAARAGGLPITAEATPHHLALTEACCEGYDPVFKVNPPLRTPDDVAAVRAGVADASIDAIATDHAPHPQEAKEMPFDQAPPGMLGLEWAFGVAVDALVASGQMTLGELLAAMSWRPALIAGLDTHGGTVAEGRVANLCVLDPDAQWTVEAGHTASRSRNVPWVGKKLTGRVRHTISRGELAVLDGELVR